MIENFTVENKYHLDVLACAYAEYFGKIKLQESIKRMFGRPQAFGLVATETDLKRAAAFAIFRVVVEEAELLSIGVAQRNEG